MGSMKDQMKGMANVTQGRLKQAWSKDTTNGGLESEGATQELKGNAQRLLGNVKSTLGNAFHRIGSRIRRTG